MLAIGPHYRVLVYFVAYTGLRFGEAVALRIKRLDLLRGGCEIVESATEVGSAGMGPDQDRPAPHCSGDSRGTADPIQLENRTGATQ
jgi:integrase